jgi:hypothetical protein
VIQCFAIENRFRKEPGVTDWCRDNPDWFSTPVVIRLSGLHLHCFSIKMDAGR